jgi:hypothetical protein
MPPPIAPGQTGTRKSLPPLKHGDLNVLGRYSVTASTPAAASVSVLGR